MIEKILAKMANISHDKLLHFVYGATLFAILFIFMDWWAFIIIIILAVIKEAYDRQTQNHTPDVWDAVATIIGAVVVALSHIF